MPGAEPLFRVLFVCAGNTCRSPLAAAALVRALGDRAGQVEVTSAGTAAFDGAPASEGSRQVAARSGLDLSRHKARRLDRAVLSGVDLVLLMDPRDLPQVRALDPEAAEQSYGLADFAQVLRVLVDRRDARRFLVLVELEVPGHVHEDVSHADDAGHGHHVLLADGRAVELFDPEARTAGWPDWVDGHPSSTVLRGASEHSR